MSSKQARKRCHLWSVVLLCTTQVCLDFSEAFTTLPRDVRFPTTTTGVPARCLRSTALEAAARSAGGRRKKPSNPLASSKKAKPSKPTAAAVAKPPAPGPKRRARAPPWQVLGTQEAAKNVEQEIQRRRLVQEGTIPTHQTSLSNGWKEEADTSATTQLSKSFLTPAQQMFCNWKRVSPFTTPLQLRFLGAYLNSRNIPPSSGVPEIAFLGRSNVGKSSLLNRLSSMSASDGSTSKGTNAFARVGQTPGATASVNFYVLSQSSKQRSVDWLGLVDLPGYGYAKLSRDRQAAIQQVAERYLLKRGPELALGILLVDVRRIPTQDDRAALAALYDIGLPILVVATKRDKLKANELPTQLERIREELGLPKGQPLCVSSVSGEGCRELWKIIVESCENAVREFKSQYEGGETENEILEQVDLTSDGMDLGKDISIEMDLEEWDGEEELVYSQGFDWVHGNGIMYDVEVADLDDDGEEEDNDSFEIKDGENLVTQRETLKSLKRKVRRLERRGEI